MLLVPLVPLAALPAQAAAMAGSSDVVVSTTPQVRRPAEAWSFISGAWNRLNAAKPNPEAAAPTAAPAPASPAATLLMPSRHVENTAVPSISLASTAPAPTAQSPSHQPRSSEPLPLNAMPMTGARPAPPVDQAAQALWSDYVERCMAIKGVAHCCIFDVERQRPLAHDGTQRMADRLAAKGSMLISAMIDSNDVLAFEPAQPDAVITLAEHFLLIRPLPGRPGVALHLVLDRDHGNVGVTRAQLHLIEQSLLSRAD
jgi:hypothetical protein